MPLLQPEVEGVPVGVEEAAAAAVPVAVEAADTLAAAERAVVAIPVAAALAGTLAAAVVVRILEAVAAAISVAVPVQGTMVAATPVSEQAAQHRR
jgi:hypothetical protein